MNTLEILEKLPKFIGGYELITQNLLDIKRDKESFVDYFNNIPKGYLEEALVTYDNRVFAYSLRVKDRGDKLSFEFSKYKIFSDYIGPLSATNLITLHKDFDDFPYILEEFMNWFEHGLVFES